MLRTYSMLRGEMGWLSRLPFNQTLGAGAWLTGISGEMRLDVSEIARI
jgi:hypothetical protein